MPPKKPAADSEDPTEPTSADAPAKDTAGKNSDAAAQRRLTAHPSTAVMVREALQALDSRKGVSSQAIQNYIKQKYPSVDLVRLKHFVRNSLKKGIENGTLVRPANSSITTGALGKFRLAPKVKESKPKSENTDPNVKTVSKEENEDKKPRKAGTSKKTSKNEVTKSSEDLKPPKKTKKDEGAAPSKVPPAKKPKPKKADAKGDEEGSTDSTKSKPAKTIKKVKTVKASQSKAAKAGSDAPAVKATGKRGKKPVE
ncbi:protein B4 [Melanotaenia boesemani]|uniref:protein B4 n=1 Tax=Melanotaenia boesemani TaxID=1250792 RepID=UPI001C0590D6|nr:protein B4 [Melanotaenia boesemani]